MEDLPVFIGLIFGLTTMLTVYIFYSAAQYAKNTHLIILSWLVLQAVISFSGFYTVTDTLPPRFLLLVIPPLILIITLFFTTKGRNYLDKLDIKKLTLLHIVRVPVEIVLFLLFTYNTVPELMTFEGRNFDILSGITAPFIYYFGFVKKTLSYKVIIFWNFLCLGLLINIVVNAVLSAPFTFQQFAFDQPNIAVLYFPFVWLPCCVVPLVLLSHLVVIRQLNKSLRKNNY